MAIEWNDELLTGAAIIDAEHRELFARVNELLAHARQPDEVEVARRCLRALKQHAETHFAAEEREMEAVAYPARAMHRDEHDNIHQYLQSFEEELAAEEVEPQLLVVATRVLGNWLVTHTTTFDRDFATFLARQR